MFTIHGAVATSTLPPKRTPLKPTAPSATPAHKRSHRCHKDDPWSETRKTTADTMYTNCRASSLLEWKIITDRDAEIYLLQSFLERRNSQNTEFHTQEPHQDRKSNQGTLHKTNLTRYVETETNSGAEEANGKQEELKPRRQRKVTKKAILGMIKSGHITPDEGKTELRKLGISMENKEEKQKTQPPKVLTVPPRKGPSNNRPGKRNKVTPEVMFSEIWGGTSATPTEASPRRRRLESNQ